MCLLLRKEGGKEYQKEGKQRSQELICVLSRKGKCIVGRKAFRDIAWDERCGELEGKRRLQGINSNGF